MHNSLIAAMCVGCGCSLAGAQTVATFIGPDAGLFEDPANWDIGIAPFNDGSNTYQSTIPGRSFLWTSGDYEVSGLTGGTLGIRTNASLKVLGPLALGVVGVSNAGARLTIDDPNGVAHYGNVEYYSNNGGGVIENFGTRLEAGASEGAMIISADGPQARVLFPSLVSAHFDSMAGDRFINAQGGAEIDLSSLQSATLRNESDTAEVQGGSLLRLNSFELLSVKINVSADSTVQLAPQVTMAGGELAYERTPGNEKTIPNIFSVTGIKRSKISAQELVLLNLSGFDPGSSLTLSANAVELPALASLSEGASIAIAAKDVTLPLLGGLTPGSSLSLNGVLDAPLLTKVVGSTVTLRENADLSAAPALTSFRNSEIEVFLSAGQSRVLHGLDASDVTVRGTGTLSISEDELEGGLLLRPRDGAAINVSTPLVTGPDDQPLYFLIFQSGGGPVVLDSPMTIIGGDSASNIQFYTQGGAIHLAAGLWATTAGKVDFGAIGGSIMIDGEVHVNAGIEVEITAYGGGSIDIANPQNLIPSVNDANLSDSGTLVSGGSLAWTLATDPAPGSTQPLHGQLVFNQAGAWSNEAITADIGQTRDVFTKAGPRIRLDAEGEPITVTLTDSSDNSGTGNDAVYLFSDDLATPALDLTPGSTLVLNGVNAFARNAGEPGWTHLNAIVPNGSGCVPYGDGLLCASVACPPDINADGVLDIGDIQGFIALFIASNLAADVNGDGLLDLGDIQVFVDAFLAGC